MTDPVRPPGLDTRDRAVILALAQRHGMTEWDRPPATLITVGDAEIFYALTRDGDRVAVVKTSRGSARTEAGFPTAAEAARHLMTMLGSPAMIRSLEAELTAIESLLGPAGARSRPPEVGEVVTVGHPEGSYLVLAERATGRFEEHQRGVLDHILTASTVLVALRFLLFRLATMARPAGWPSIQPSAYAPDVTLDPVADGQRLTWPGGWLLFGRERSVERARPFSWVVRAPAAVVAATLRDPRGAPLFPPDRPR